MSAGAILIAKGLDARYGAAHVLFGIDLQVDAGQVVALMGRNGAGKSTTIKALINLLDDKHGRVEFLGKDISNAKPYEIARLGLGFVPEDRRIFSDLTVLENLEVGRQPARKNETGGLIQPWTPASLFELFPNLAEARNRTAGRMSGGEQQMLAVARTLMGNPYAILMDEPSEGVAPVIVDQMVDMIVTLKANGVAILLSEQNLPFARLVADRAYVLERGEIKFEGSMDELRDNEDVRRAYLEV